MPIYEFECSKCSFGFDVSLKSFTSEKNTVVCPRCNSHDASRRFSVFGINANKSSATSYSSKSCSDCSSTSCSTCR